MGGEQPQAGTDEIEQPTMNKWFEPVPFAIRIFLSAFGGSLTGLLYFPAFTIYKQGFGLTNLLHITAIYAVFAPFVFVMSLPLAFIALLIGSTLKKQIAKKPVVWTIVATLVTWITAFSILMLSSSKNQWWMTHSNAERLTYVITSGDNMLVLAGALGAGATFYLLGLVRLDSERAA